MDEMYLAAEEVYKNRNRFIIIGVTGRSGSGCSTVADILTCKFEELLIPPSCLSSSATDHDRKKFILRNFAQRNWKPFFKIKMSDIITSYVFQCEYDKIARYIADEAGLEFPFSEVEFKAVNEENNCLEMVSGGRFSQIDKDDVYQYMKDVLPMKSEEFKKNLGNTDDGKCTSMYQKFGNNIRKYGSAVPVGNPSVANIYTLAERINKTIKVIRKYNTVKDEQSYFVIDAFRNPFEALFFQERYSAFYLLGVRCSEEDRLDRLTTIYNFAKKKIQDIDDRENPKSDPLKSLENFISQDIATCIQLSDVLVENCGKSKSANYNDLKEQLIRYISLMQHPGLINPSTNEKMMQVAFTAKLNSGCLSRKVGAVVTNAVGVPKAIGWNSSPEGQTSCLLRNAHTMGSKEDSYAYSEYETQDKDFLAAVDGYVKGYDDKLSERGLNCAFCFKDIENKIEGYKANQVHNRALHAEENAFLQVAKFGGEGIKGGKLYTTASPCDLCARKAFQLGIRQIFYIDPYPGIATSHVLNVGLTPPQLVLFRGAIGAAYHKLYSSILPYKDELYSYMTGDFFKKPD
jgi:dCMP deaminase